MGLEGSNLQLEMPSLSPEHSHQLFHLHIQIPFTDTPTTTATTVQFTIAVAATDVASSPTTLR